ncbi:MAG: hypothetical protein ACLGQH_11150 [Acidobacteriota bacterium]
MNAPDKYPKIKAVAVLPGNLLRIDFGREGVREVDVMPSCRGRWSALQDPAVFAAVAVSPFGSGLTWPSLGEVGGNVLWRLAEEQQGNAWPHEAFAAWMQRMGFSAAKAAEALGVTRRTVIYYKTGSKTISKLVRLACRALELEKEKREAA